MAGLEPEPPCARLARVEPGMRLARARRARPTTGLGPSLAFGWRGALACGGPGLAVAWASTSRECIPLASGAGLGGPTGSSYVISCGSHGRCKFGCAGCLYEIKHAEHLPHQQYGQQREEPLQMKCEALSQRDLPHHEDRRGKKICPPRYRIFTSPHFPRFQSCPKTCTDREAKF